MVATGNMNAQKLLLNSTQTLFHPPHWVLGKFLLRAMITDTTSSNRPMIMPGINPPNSSLRAE